MTEYNPRNWFWVVGGDVSRAWSSSARAYVFEWPANRVARIANEVELYDALAKQGLTSRAPQGPFTVDDVRAAFANIDAAATGAANDAASLAIVAEDIGMMLRSTASSTRLAAEPAISQAMRLERQQQAVSMRSVILQEAKARTKARSRVGVAHD